MPRSSQFRPRPRSSDAEAREVGDPPLPDEPREDLPRARPYGDLTDLNTDRTIIDAVGREMLARVAGDYLDLLQTSSAVYEKNGDYALGIFSSGWCRMMDAASRARCGTDDNREALRSGRWHCHESCWNEAARPTIETGQPKDIACRGGIRLYAVPILAGTEIVGSMNVGYGDPPRDPLLLAELAERFDLDVADLRRAADAYRSRPRALIGLAMRWLGTSATLIGEIVRRRRAEKALGEQLAFTRTLADNAGAALFMLDDELRCTFMNPAAESVTGYSLDELRERPFHATMRHCRTDGHPLPEEECIFCRALGEETTVRAMDEHFVRKGGEIYPASCVMSPVRMRGRPAAVLLMRDVTEQRRNERERELLLESERAARADAERADRLKDEFVATVSHELRTPLNAIQGWTQLLQRPCATPAKVAKGLEVIERNTRLLGQIVSDLLDTSRIVSGKFCLDLQTVDLPAVIDAALEGLRVAADAKGLDLRVSYCPVDGEVRADPVRMQQVISNLVSNAIKFTPRGGRVEVSVTQRDGRVVIAVRDTGQGIEACFLPSIFDRFRQADASTARRHGGLGLGLAIVRHVVEEHGGTIVATSEGPGRGAEFAVTLPFASTTVRAPPRYARALDRMAPPSDAVGIRGTTVLVVDDDPDAREIVHRMLDEHGASVASVASASEALCAISACPPDVVVSDIGMPGMDGYELASRLRADPRTRHLPLVALTAFARAEDRERARAAGFCAHVTKPIEAAELFAAVADAREGSRERAADRVASGPE